MRYELHTEIHIDASPEAVWDVLMDRQSYGDWNPFVVSSEGSAAVGEKLVNRLEPPDGKPMTFRPTVTVVDPIRSFEWIGHLGPRGIFDGRHRFDVEPTETGTRFVQRESFAGLLVRPLRKSLDDRTRRGFEAMNAALKSRVEALATTSP